jgi:hypothetical protein
MRLFRPTPVDSFIDEQGVRRVLNAPGETATPRQLRLLNDMGCLALIEPEQLQPIAKGEAAAALDALVKGTWRRYSGDVA